LTKYVVAEVGEIPPGGRKIVEVDGRSIGVFHLNGDYFALLNWCPHQGAALCQGQLWSALDAEVPGEYKTSRDGEIIACLWHGWEFDLRTGQSWCDPERLRVRAYDVRVEPGSAIAGDGADETAAPAPGMVPGPYTATTFPVTTEGQYVVVDLGRRAGEPPASAHASRRRRVARARA
jgi:3-phenylpropionate/trans-cinnamate dioxygenase ferredoxin subunit